PRNAQGKYYYYLLILSLLLYRPIDYYHQPILAPTDAQGQYCHYLLIYLPHNNQHLYYSHHAD
ncbi:hypothetical protein, partial [Oligella urethralis]|uniref:hypothetical protein n=1 Tax=Oligella urethralis TaxID=90245 RepID=UPI0019553DB0